MVKPFAGGGFGKHWSHVRQKICSHQSPKKRAFGEDWHDQSWEPATLHTFFWEKGAFDVPWYRFDAHNKQKRVQLVKDSKGMQRVLDHHCPSRPSNSPSFLVVALWMVWFISINLVVMWLWGLVRYQYSLQFFASLFEQRLAASAKSEDVQESAWRFYFFFHCQTSVSYRDNDFFVGWSWCYVS